MGLKSRKSAKEYYHANKKRIREYQKEYREKNNERLRYQEYINRESWRKELLEIIGGGECKDCGEEDFRVLHFDHVRGEKKSNVAHYLGRSWSKALEEAKKCEVVCANCHAIRTYERREKPKEVSPVWIRLSKEECPKGHPKTKENTYRWRNKRFCRQCQRDYHQEKKKK